MRKTCNMRRLPPAQNTYDNAHSRQVVRRLTPITPRQMQMRLCTGPQRSRRMTLRDGVLAFELRPPESDTDGGARLLLITRRRSTAHDGAAISSHCQIEELAYPDGFSTHPQRFHLSACCFREGEDEYRLPL